MPKYISSAVDEEITLKERISALSDKFDYIEQSLYLLETNPDVVDRLITQFNSRLDATISDSLREMSDYYATKDVTAATNTANIPAVPKMTTTNTNSSELPVSMVVVSEVDDGRDEYTINEADISENLRDAVISVTNSDVADIKIEWKVDKDFTESEFNTLADEISRYFTARKSTDLAGSSSVSVELIALGDGSKQSKTMVI